MFRLINRTHIPKSLLSAFEHKVKSSKRTAKVAYQESYVSSYRDKSILKTAVMQFTELPVNIAKSKKMKTFKTNTKLFLMNQFKSDPDVRKYGILSWKNFKFK